jgi:hypothetical protein
MRRTDGCIVLNHPEIFPAAFLSERFKVDTSHDTLAGPMVTPIVDGEIPYPGTATCGGMRFSNWGTSGKLVLPWVAVRFAQTIQEDSALLG